MHVIPVVDTSAADAAAAAAEADAAGASPVPPAQQCLTASLEAMQKLVARRVTSFSQKRALLAVLKGAAASVAACEAKLARLEVLSDEEQALYDTAIALPDKTAWLAAQMEAHIDAGQLTKAEQVRPRCALGCFCDALWARMRPALGAATAAALTQRRAGAAQERAAREASTAAAGPVGAFAGAGDEIRHLPPLGTGAPWWHVPVRPSFRDPGAEIKTPGGL